MTAILALHAVVGFGLLFGGGRLGRRGAWVAMGAPAATVIWLLFQYGGIIDSVYVTQHVPWISQLGLGLDLRLDGFSTVMLLLVSGIGVLIFAYAASYFPKSGAGLARLIGLLTLFAGAMVGLVLADNLLVLYGFWELTSITSFLLIGNDHAKPEARAAALQALLITGAGGLAMLAGFLVLGNAAGTFQLSEILASPPSGTPVSVALVLILLGAFTKSAQWPFHSWLPGAMVAPTPVSAYLHSATMVKAGVYLIARFSPAFAPIVGWWRPVVVTIGLITMITAGIRAMRQHDLKVLLAHGTVSQLGFMVAIFGIGSTEAEAAGVALLLAHGAFKAAAFMVVGLVDHQFGTRDIRKLPRLDGSWWPTALIAVVAAGSMAGLPLLFGFVAKEAVIQAIIDEGHGLLTVALGAVVVGAAITTAYSARFVWGALGRDATEPVDLVPRERTPAWIFVLPGLVLTAFTLAAGLLPRVAEQLVGAAERDLHPDAHGVHLALWHGLNQALLLSAIAIATGLGLFAIRRTLTPILAKTAGAPDANDGYHVVLRGLNVVADRVTGVSQPGSLPVYAGVILLTSALVPLWALFGTGGDSWPGLPEWVETPWHLPVVALIVVAAVASSATRRRFAAALFLGVVGYAMAALFVVQGAPDLALTQVAIETLTTVLFVLVLRRLPDRFGWAGSHADPSSRNDGDRPIIDAGTTVPPPESVMNLRRRAVRVAVSFAVASGVFVLAIAMSAPQPETPTSHEMVERALPDGQGRNVVNVILVDFRGFDTMGEITVLASAAIGTVALARAGRRRRVGSGAGHGATEALGDAAREREAPALKIGRLITLDVAARVVFAIVLVGSLYLLFVGHNQPGGGFVGGILAGAAVALVYMAGGLADVRQISRGKPWNFLGAGLLCSVGAATVPVLLGHPVLTNGYIKRTLPLLGEVKVTSATVFDLGVYLVVLGLALMMFESFGDDPVSDEIEASVISDIDPDAVEVTG